jgi:aminoglycoside phosphotransferase (APT) family kinase protein
MTPEQLHARLQTWLAHKMPEATGVALSPLTKPSIGFSNETLVCYVTYRFGELEKREDLVVRLEPADFQIFPEYDLRGQARIMEILAGTDVPVPNVRWIEEDTEVLGRAFYVMDRIAGEVPSEVPPYHAVGVFADAKPEERAAMWWSGIETLARVHAVDWKAAGLGFLGAPRKGAPVLRPQLEYYERMLEWAEEDGEPQTVLRAAQGWLRENEPDSERVALCWGDSRLPNVIYRDGRIAGVLDWEMAFLGDPEADLAWWLFMDWFASGGYGVARLEGMPEREETVARYEELTGHSVRNLFFYEVFAGMRFGVIMVRVAAMMRLRGMPLPTPDFASNNPATRKVAEMLGLRPPGDG